MNGYVLTLLFAMLLPAQRWLAQVSGRVLDHESKPLVGAQITYTHVGQFTNGGAMGNSDPAAAGITSSGTGRVYKTKTNKKGEFVLLGLIYGVYQIEIRNTQGELVYSGRRLVGDNADANISNVLEVDLSTVPPPGHDNSLVSVTKKSKEQLALIRQENANVAKINHLIGELHNALGVQDWKQAAELLQQLVALDPNRWEFYQNLGTIQSSASDYQEAAQTFRKGVEVAQKTSAAHNDISGMLISEGDAYLRMDRLTEAIPLYNQAAELAANPAMAYYHACNAELNRGTPAAAIDACNRAIAANPAQWDFYQTLGNAQVAASKPQDALGTYEKGIEIAKKELAEQPDSTRAKNVMGQMLNAEGNIYANLSRYELAIKAFAEAAKVSAYAALPYFNLCAMYYNLNRMPEAAAACDQAIASDPTMYEAYYLKAAALFGRGTVQQGLYVAPPGTREALNQYLGLAPFGQHAQLVREMLEKLDEKVETTSKPDKPVKK
jgi:tetratricopeptide (TPR) repeat protein